MSLIHHPPRRPAPRLPAADRLPDATRQDTALLALLAVRQLGWTRPRAAAALGVSIRTLGRHLTEAEAGLDAAAELRRMLD